MNIQNNVYRSYGQKIGRSSACSFSRVGLIVGTILCTGAASAAVTAGTGGGLGLSVDVSVGGIVGLGVGPLSEVDVISPTPDSLSTSVVSVNQSALVLGGVTAQNGVDAAIVASASSDVTGLSNTGTATGSATTNNLGITLIPGVTLVPDLLTLSSTTIGSTTTSSGSHGSLSSSGTVNLEGLAIEVDGISLNLDSSPSPNTIVDLLASGVTDPGILANLTIILNEQIPTGDGVGATGMTTNALRISLGALDIGLPGGVLESEIIVGQSSSSLTATIPEPSLLGLMSALPVLFMFRRRKS